MGLRRGNKVPVCLTNSEDRALEEMAVFLQARRMPASLSLRRKEAWPPSVCCEEFIYTHIHLLLILLQARQRATSIIQSTENNLNP